MSLQGGSDVRVITDGPKVFLVGHQHLGYDDMDAYLGHAGHGTSDWLGEIIRGEVGEDISGGEALCEMGGRVCYDGATELLTRDKWVKLPDLSPGEEVATLNRSTGELEFQLPEEYIARDYVGPLYRVESSKFSLAVTTDHRLYADRGMGLELIPAADLVGKRYRMLQHAKYAGEEAVPVDLPGHTYTQSHVPSGYRTGKCHTTVRRVGGKVIDVHQLSDWAEFLGYYFSEGSLKGERAVALYQNPDKAGRIIGVIRRLGYEPGVYEDSRNGVLQIVVHSSTLRRHLSGFGKRAAEKTLPGYVFSWPAEHRGALLDALMFGDGHRHGGARVYSTKSMRLAEDVQRLIFLSGKPAFLSGPNTEGMYHVREGKPVPRGVNASACHDFLEPYKGKVYCVSVPNRVLAVRRGGKIVFCGNCYDSFTKRRPGGTGAYLRHIKEMGHGRVLEHAVYSFVLADVSRACSHELYTHTAGWSKSMRSTRYVDESDAVFVCPPDLAAGAHLARDEMAVTPDNYRLLLDYREWEEGAKASLAAYRELVRRLSERWEGTEGEKTERRKRARQAARYTLPHSLATTVFATVNGRALRHFFESRASPHADVEIRQLAGRMWEKVAKESPSLFGDYTKVELGDGTFALETPWRKV